MIRQLRTAVVMVALLTLLVGIAYPLLVTGVAQIAFAGKANGSMVSVGGHVVGSQSIGQSFTEAKYFHPRPSAAGDGYDATASSASNQGPSNDELLAAVADRVEAYRAQNGLSDVAVVPSDAVTASASGLDPHISVANARAQAQRVATARGVPVATVRELIDANTKRRSLGFLGDPGVNVLQLNLALDRTR